MSYKAGSTAGRQSRSIGMKLNTTPRLLAIVLASLLCSAPVLAEKPEWAGGKDKQEHKHKDKKDKGENGGGDGD